MRLTVLATNGMVSRGHRSHVATKRFSGCGTDRGVYQMWRLLCWPLLSVAVVVRPPFSQGSLHEQMHTMMSDSEEAPWKDRLISETDDADDPYMKEAAEGLSKALGPRWDQKALEVDANRKTRALLKGISGSSGMQSLQKMLGALR
ncbi:unnamed protein product [Durusdinium trenchii]|uniref:Uncharacterized protein n=1 Tax=Durusdinium trenchii TaxID=1381693 RepID=A0ABP0P118_9DINO